MGDPGRLFGLAQRASAGWLRDQLGPCWWRWRDVLALLPVRAVGEGFFEVLEPRQARERDLRPVVAVRAGVPAGWIEADLADTTGQSVAYPAALANPAHGTPRDAELQRCLATRAGHEVVDLLACDWTLAKPPRALMGMALALGDPDGEAADAADPASPLRLAGTVAEVLFGPPGGVLPLGDAVARAAYLRRADAVLAPSLEAGRAVRKLLETPPVMPKLFVLAGGAKTGAAKAA